MAAEGPILDESGWALEFPSKEGTVICIISGNDGGQAPSSLRAFNLGDVSDDFGRIHRGYFAQFERDRGIKGIVTVPA